MPAKKKPVQVADEEKTVEITMEDSTEVIEPAVIEQPKKEETKEKYLECPFCGETSTEIRNTDLTSSWCSKCGKCFPVIWKER